MTTIKKDDYDFTIDVDEKTYETALHGFGWDCYAEKGDNLLLVTLYRLVNAEDIEFLKDIKKGFDKEELKFLQKEIYEAMHNRDYLFELVYVIMGDNKCFHYGDCPVLDKIVDYPEEEIDNPALSGFIDYISDILGMGKRFIKNEDIIVDVIGYIWGENKRKSEDALFWHIVDEFLDDYFPTRKNTSLEMLLDYLRVDYTLYDDSWCIGLSFLLNYNYDYIILNVTKDVIKELQNELISFTCDLVKDDLDFELGKFNRREMEPLTEEQLEKAVCLSKQAVKSLGEKWQEKLLKKFL